MAEQRIKQEILTRVNWLYSVFVVIGVVIVLRIIFIQVMSHEVAAHAEAIYGRIFYSQSVRAHRGAILARDGEPLANSILRYQVEMDFGSEGFDSLNTYYRQSDSLAKLLSRYFGDRSYQQYRTMFRNERAKHYQLKHRGDSLVPRSEGWFGTFIDILRGERMKSIKLYDTIRSHRPVRILPREIDYAEWQTLRRYPILNWNMGMTYRLVDRDERVYTHGDLASRTIGALKYGRGNDYGVEKIFNEFLSGEDGQVLKQRIARGFYGQVVGGDNREAVDGMDVVTTIDIELQDMATEALRSQMIYHRAIWGTTIIMDVESGDLLAIANLDRKGEDIYSEGENRAMGARSEPGSTWKLASTMALLEVAKMPTSQIYNSEDGARIKLGKATVQDSHKGFKEVDLRTAFAQSLNVYFAKAVYGHFKDNPKAFTDFLRSIHLDKPTGFEAFGEPSPLFYEQGDRGWYPHMTLINMAYGYGVEQTPLQMITLYNGVANGGRMMAPRLVSEVRKDGSTVKRYGTKTLVERMASQQTIDTLRSFMNEVCTSGTAAWYLGRFDGFEVGAKTGTAQFAQGNIKYADGYYIGSLIGFVPYENPKYTILTTMQVKRGMTKSIYGGGVAGPVLKSLMQQLYNREHGWHAQLDTLKRMSVIDSIEGCRARSLNDMEEVAQIMEQDKMPNLYGMGLRDAIYLVESCGMSATVVGEGRVWRQSVRAGEKVRSGMNITINLK